MVVGILSAVLVWAKRGVDTANLPKDVQDAWAALMSVPTIVPYIFIGVCLASLAWAFWSDRKEFSEVERDTNFLPAPAPAPAPLPQPDPHHDIRLEIERARLEADRLDALSSLDFRRGLDAYVRGESRAPALLPQSPVSAAALDAFREAWKEIETDRIPFAGLRLLASDYGIKVDHLDPASANLAYEIEGELREAAANNRLVVRGRPYHGPVRDNDPLIPIPANHFNEYLFQHGALHYVLPNDKTSTTTMALQMQGKVGLDGVTFYDLHVSTKAARAVMKRIAGEKLKGGQ